MQQRERLVGGRLELELVLPCTGWADHRVQGFEVHCRPGAEGGPNTSRSPLIVPKSCTRLCKAARREAESTPTVRLLLVCQGQYALPSKHMRLTGTRSRALRFVRGLWGCLGCLDTNDPLEVPAQVADAARRESD